MRISVVIPVHDRRDVLGRAIASVLAQTLSPDEVIVVDDASGDGSAEEVRRRFPGVHVLVNEANRGVSYARNRGVARASGDWVAFLDSDDAWLPGKLERQVEALTKSTQAPLCHTDEIWIRNGRRVNPRLKHKKRGGDIFEYCLPLCVISPSSALVRRDVLDDLGGFDESLPACEDYDLWLRICVRWPVAYVDEPLLFKYGGHADQLSRRYWGMDRFRVSALERLLSGPPLPRERRRAVLTTMIEKLEILSGGAARRGKSDAAEHWRQRCEWARAELASTGCGAS